MSAETSAALIARLAHNDALENADDLISDLALQIISLRNELIRANDELAALPPTHRAPSAYPSYEVARHGGCVLIYGVIPAGDYAALRSALGAEVVESRKLATLAGAALALGTRENIAAFVRDLGA